MTDIASVAYDALNLSKQNERDIVRHEEICAERYAGINKAMLVTDGKIDAVNKTLLKVAVWGIGIMVSVIAFLAIALFQNQREFNSQMLEQAHLASTK